MSYKHYQQTTVLMRSFDIHHNNIKLETQASNHVPNYIHVYIMLKCILTCTPHHCNVYDSIVKNNNINYLLFLYAREYFCTYVPAYAHCILHHDPRSTRSIICIMKHNTNNNQG